MTGLPRHLSFTRFFVSSVLIAVRLIEKTTVLVLAAPVLVLLKTWVYDMRVGSSHDQQTLFQTRTLVGTT